MRRYWHKARDGRAVERSRNRVNLAVKNAVLKEGFCVIRHPNIRSTEINLYRSSGNAVQFLPNMIRRRITERIVTPKSCKIPPLERVSTRFVHITFFGILLTLARSRHFSALWPFIPTC
jgi:hypothetical protein